MSEALLVIDIQNDYFPGGAMALPGAEAAGAVASGLLARFRAAGLPVIHVQHEAVHPGATFFLPGTGGLDIHPCVAPNPGEKIVRKHFPNSFRETDLLETLRGLGVARLTVCGMMTNMCVDAGVRAAADLGFACRVAADACAARPLSFGGVDVPAPQVHAAFLAALGLAYAQVAPAAELDLP